MVLSNKKLKQKLRFLVSESLAATESQKSHKDVDQQLESLRELLGSKPQRPKPSQRPNRRKKPSFPKDSEPGEGIEDTQTEKGENVDCIALSEKRKRKKRKSSSGDGDQESSEKNQKKSKKKGEKKKWKKKKEAKKMKSEGGEDGKKDGKENGGASEERNEGVVGESIKIDESEQNAKKVYVGGIPYYSTEDDIRSFFEGCGTVAEIDCMRFPETGKFRGIAILTFKTDAAAKRALALDGADMGGFYLKIQPYKAKYTQKQDFAQKPDFAPQIVDGYNRIYVGNLSWDITEEDLRGLFTDCKIDSVRFGMDKETGEFRGYAHVDFSDGASLAAALKLDQKVVCGRPARISCAVPKKAVETKAALKPESNKAAETNLASKTDGKKADDDTSARSSKKKKRRTCYECGVAGHLSSECPRKKAVEANNIERD